MKQIIPFIYTALLIAGCASVDQENEGKAIILHNRSIHTIIAVDGQEPKRREHNLHTVIPDVVLEPGTYEFTILYNLTKAPTIAGVSKEMKLTATVNEGYYFIEDTNGSLSLKPTKAH